jgi:hypothetical protein
MNSTASSGMGYESQQGPLVGIQIFLLVVALAMCSLRVYSRLVIVHSLGPDDYLMIIATVSAGPYVSSVPRLRAYRSLMAASLYGFGDQCMCWGELWLGIACSGCPTREL